MNIQQQSGFVSSIVQTPFENSEIDRSLRDDLFDLATIDSGCSPSLRADNFDESVLVFENPCQALGFLMGISRRTQKMHAQSNIDVSVHSSLCFGGFFVHDEQIYGEAVNEATRLSMTSRENETLVCGIDMDIVGDFIDSNWDLVSHTRNFDQNSISIGVTDQDSTCGRFNERILQLRYRDKVLEFDLTRARSIEIGRADNAEILIDSDHISRRHATIKLHYDQIHIEDHSFNGTYLYFDKREIFLTNDMMKIGDHGVICCGLEMGSGNNKQNAISYQIVDRSAQTLSAA